MNSNIMTRRRGAAGSFFYEGGRGRGELKIDRGSQSKLLQRTDGRRDHIKQHLKAASLLTIDLEGGVRLRPPRPPPPPSLTVLPLMTRQSFVLRLFMELCCCSCLGVRLYLCISKYISVYIYNIHIYICIYICC